MEKEKFSLKDHLYNKEKVTQLALEIKSVYTSFNDKQFIKDVVKDFPTLELKQRVTHMAVCLQKHLPQNYLDAIAIIIKALPPALSAKNTDNDFGDFIHAPYGEFVSKYGCTKAYFKASTNALYEITKRFSVEFSIRLFINKFPTEMLALLYKWATDKNYHVRRLCSEGSRPILPWAEKIGYTTAETLPILQMLYADPTRYVTRSVANHLNDISKKEPELVIKTLKLWKKENKQDKTELEFITKHALRNLIKQGNADALAMVGIGDSNGVSLQNIIHDKKVKVGDYLHFSFEVKSKEPKALLIDYIMHFKLKNNYGTKIFKLKTIEAEANKKYELSKRHKFLENISTRTYYEGLHKLSIQINGTILTTFEFELNF